MAGGTQADAAVTGATGRPSRCHEKVSKKKVDDDCNDVDPHGAPVILSIENGWARRRRDRRQRTFRRHEHLTMKMTFMSATYHL